MGNDLDRLKEDVVFRGMPGNPDGQNKTILNFINSIFIMEQYNFSYPTAAAETSNKYDAKTWFQEDGMKGSFTYDDETKLLSMTVTEIYIKKSGVTTSCQADY